MKRIAVIGCGAIADSFHIPALLSEPGLQVLLVDPDLDRARALARKHGIEEVARSHEEVADRLDAAIIASPHHTHVPIALSLVEAGVHVLSEKPLGVTSEEVEVLRDRASAAGVTVAVNQTRRFIPACREIKRIVEEGSLGEHLSVVANEGDRFDWPTATASMFGQDSGGRGLLLDIGAHVLDLMVWWFGPHLRVRDYFDDSFGGSEASVALALGTDDVSIDIRLSWLAKQRNSYSFEGDRGRLTWGIYDLDTVSLHLRDGARKVIRSRDKPRDFSALASIVLRDFLDACETGSAPVAGPDDVLPTMRLMEECYAARKSFDMEWHAFALEHA